MQVSSVNYCLFNNFKTNKINVSSAHQNNTNVKYDSYRAIYDNKGISFNGVYIKTLDKNKYNVFDEVQDICNEAKGIQKHFLKFSQNAKSIYDKTIENLEEKYLLLAKNKSFEGFVIESRRMPASKDGSIIKEFRLFNKQEGLKRTYTYKFDGNTKKISAIHYEEMDNENTNTIDIDYKTGKMSVECGKHKIGGYNITDGSFVIINGVISSYNQHINERKDKVGDTVITSEHIKKRYEYDEDNSHTYYENVCYTSNICNDKITEKRMNADKIMTFKSDDELELYFLNPVEIKTNSKQTVFSANRAFCFEDGTSGTFYQDFKQFEDGKIAFDKVEIF